MPNQQLIEYIPIAIIVFLVGAVLFMSYVAYVDHKRFGIDKRTKIWYWTIFVRFLALLLIVIAALIAVLKK